MGGKLKMKVTDEKILSFISSYIEAYGYSPSMRDIAKATGLSIAPTKYRLDRLRESGAITFEDGMARTIRVVR